MTRIFLNIVILLGLLGASNTFYCQPYYAEEEAFKGKHETVILPSRILMSEIESRAHNIYEDILLEKYGAIKQETDAIITKAKKINELFFPVDPGLNAWYRRSEAFDPEILKAIENLKANFNIYLRRLTANIGHLQEAVERKDERDIACRYTKMIKQACVKCHSKYAGREIPVLRQYLSIEPEPLPEEKSEKKEKKSGTHKEAMEAYKQATRINPDDVLSHLCLGLAYGNLDMHQEAVKAYKQAIRINPDEALTHLCLGLAYGNLDMHQEAVEAYKQAIRTNPDYAEAHFGLGSAYGKLDMRKEAVEAYKQATRIDPDYAVARFCLGDVYDKLEMYKKEIEVYKQAIRINPDDADAHFCLGSAYGNLDMHQEAVEAYKQAIRTNPDYAEAHFGLGLVYVLLNDRGSALEQYEILKSLDLP
ncbi:MAG: tetratricopeptide repeat protein [Planctomycetota bacterium]|jgi:tetratricopeptide (TPR) repeat protein